MKTFAAIVIVAAMIFIAAPAVFAEERTVPFLGTTLDYGKPVGVVGFLVISLELRNDASGLHIWSRNPNAFSEETRNAVTDAISRTARYTGISADSWSVRIDSVNHFRIYGMSLSAMVALTVISMAKGDTIAPHRVITGGIDADGSILAVGGVPLKAIAAHDAGLTLLIPTAPAHPLANPWAPPLPNEVSCVHTVEEAYAKLTGKKLISDEERRAQ